MSISTAAMWIISCFNKSFLFTTHICCHCFYIVLQMILCMTCTNKICQIDSSFDVFTRLAQQGRVAHIYLHQKIRSSLVWKMACRLSGDNVALSLTHWSRDKMAAFSQTTLSNAFSWMKILEFRLKFHWSLFLRVLSTIFQHWFW